MLGSLLFLLGCSGSLLQAAPISQPNAGLGVKFEKRSGSLPILTLPDAAYQAASYDASSDIYKWSNIRFAAPPVGELRWAKPAPAPKNSTLQDGSYGSKCPQAAIKGLNVLGNGLDSPLETAVEAIVDQIIAPLMTGGSEDCLFLDVYVPGAAVRSPSTTRLPVIHWIFGGGYVFGSKDMLEPELPFYDGSGMITQSGNNVIFVSSNYRLGAFGFLAGITMEKQGLPNAGLWDQRAALQWTHDNIALIGGDPTQVTVMGESAGAGSILHHLVAEGGTLKPLFNCAITQSPAFQAIWARREGLQDAYSQFETLAGCIGQGVACLRAASSETLITANTALNANAGDGSFIVSPSADGSFIRQLPALEFASGNYYKDLDAVLVSHVADEATIFVDGHIATDAEFTEWINDIFPAYLQTDGLTAAIENFYPGISSGAGNYSSESARVRDFIRDSSFTCNARYIATAYAGKFYNMQYSVTPGWHATDLLPIFWSPDLAFNNLGLVVTQLLPLFTVLASAYQSYLTSFARAGDPNTHRAVLTTAAWPLVDIGTADYLANVLDVSDTGFALVADDQNPRSNCDFWVDFEAAATIAGGYAPPGALVPTSLLNSTAGASEHY
ncbi:hypothetical protein MMC26_000273 [Xylographa opegraphella]|nr:hypothetical protein [Xylographa opegraphella]